MTNRQERILKTALRIIMRNGILSIMTVDQDIHPCSRKRWNLGRSKTLPLALSLTQLLAEESSQDRCRGGAKIVMECPR
jgi:hypothetical protein